MHETLVVLARQRNALVHHKIEVKLGDRTILEGSGFERKTLDEEQLAEAFL